MSEQKHRPVYNLEIHEVFGAFQTSREGLSAAEAAARQREFGLNVLEPKKESLLKRLLEPFASAFVLVLLGAIVLSLIEGQRLDAVIIAVIVGINAVIYYVQQYSVGRVLNALKRQDITYAHVIRDGDTTKIPSEELTYGDIVHIEEGMKVPADGRLIESNQIEVDEAILTGESLPVHKHAAAIAGKKEVYDQHNMLFKGTYVKAGSGLMVVTGIGNDTKLGNITSLAAQADIGRTPIEKKIDTFTKRLIVVIVCVAAVAMGLELWRGIEIEEAARFSLVIMVSAVPEELPIAMTVVLLLSARRMARLNALVKKISSIETMGAVTLIATDKTGTITKNNLSVADKHTTHASTQAFDQVIRASLNGDEEHAGDALDRILHDAVDGVEIPASWRKVKEFAFNQTQRVSGVLWQHGETYSLYIKGAPEHVLNHCGKHHRSDVKIKNMLETFTGRGYRTIAFAHKDFSVPIDKIDATTLSDMSFDGFAGLSDQLREGAEQAVREAKEAGIKVVMLTGDHVNTAAFIASQVGIAASRDEVSDSKVLETGSAEDISEKLKTTRVFGRVLPEHKYALLKATKGREITAMTGDGVNDIPALVEADAGIAMGSGTDAAKDASDIVLLDNNFRTIVSAVRAGRTALANIRKMLVYMLGTNAAEVLTILSALVIGLPLPVAAIQILWVNLATDTMTVIPLGLSPSESRQMKEPPWPANAALLNFRQVSRIITIAAVMAASVLFIFNLNLGKGLAYAQTLAFLSLIVVQWASVLGVNFEYKSWIYNFIRPNKPLWIAIGVSVLLQLAVFMTPFGSFLHVTAVDWRDALVAIAVPVTAVLMAIDLHKLVSHQVAKRRARRV